MFTNFSNRDKIDLFLWILTAVLLACAFFATLKSIDRMTSRDCDRGIKSACQYVK